MNILVTGGAGSLGISLVNELQKTIDDPEDDLKIRILDNNEHALATMNILYPSLVRKLHGSITDKDRVERAVKGVDLVIHCAAMKNLEITEYNVSELIKTNVVGTDNVISSARDAGVGKIIFISSDKAVEPTSIYGASKLIGEHTALNYNQMSSPTSRVSVFRSGNFRSSNGNVFETWDAQLNLGLPITITDLKCMRYFIETETAAKTIISCIPKMSGGEIFIPDERIMPEMSIVTLAKMFADRKGISREDINFKCIGLRKGEKISESLFNQDELIKRTHDEELHCWVVK